MAEVVTPAWDEGGSGETDALDLGVDRRWSGHPSARDTARAMSQDNVDLVRRSIRAFNSGAWDESLEYMDEGIEWRAPFVVPDQDTYVGHDGVRAFWTAWSDNFEGFRLEVEDLIDAGDDVVVVARISGQGIASGAGVRSNPFAHVARLRNGKIHRWAMYDSAQEALEAVGLRE